MPFTSSSFNGVVNIESSEAHTKVMKREWAFTVGRKCSINSSTIIIIITAQDEEEEDSCLQQEEEEPQTPLRGDQPLLLGSDKRNKNSPQLKKGRHNTSTEDRTDNLPMINFKPIPYPRDHNRSDDHLRYFQQY